MVTHCTECGTKLHGFLTGKKKINGKPYCKECYYQHLGKVIEKYPIGAPLGDIIKKQQTEGTKGARCKFCGESLSAWEEESGKDMCFHCYVEMNT
jgi:formylmethanofuran dehydrogenase subunit E